CAGIIPIFGGPCPTRSIQTLPSRPGRRSCADALRTGSRSMSKLPRLGSTIPSSTKGGETMPLITHRGATPQVHPDAYIAPNAVVCGDVHIGAEARVLFGAVVTAEDGRVTIGHRCVIRENALIRGRGIHPVEIGDNVLIGPHAHVNGANIGEECFLAT